MDQNWCGIGICLGNNQGNFQLHRFIRRENTAKCFRGGATFFDSHCMGYRCSGDIQWTVAEVRSPWECRLV